MNTMLPSSNLPSLVIVFFTVTFSIPITNVMFITTSVAFNTIIEISDAFFTMLPANIVLGMFVTAVASVTTVVIPDMTGDTAGIMITLQHKKGLVIKASRHPVFLGMTLAAIAVNFLVQRVGGWLVAILALTTRLRI